MYWVEEEERDTPFVVPDDVVDVAFAIRCRALPVDHAAALSRAVAEALPWFADEPRAGLHLIHVAESGNGWERPEGGGAQLYPSRRTKLTLRVPRERSDDALTLAGRTLDVGGAALEVGEGRVRRLSDTDALYARHVVVAPNQDEEAFLDESARRLHAMGIRFKKLLCGRAHTFEIDGETVYARSLFVADLDRAAAIRLQEEGLGCCRTLGFGLFIPHKSIKKV